MPDTTEERAGVPRPTRRTALLVAAVALASALLPVPVGVPALLATVLAGAVIVDLLGARRRRPHLERTRPPTLALRAPMDFTAETTGLEDARAVRLRQPVPPALHVDPAEAGGTRLDATLTGWHRGVHALPPAIVRSTGPLGLASVDRVVGHAEQVTVIPDLPRARRLAAARRRGRTTEEGRIRARLGLGTEFETIRDYTPDDDIRQVNWVATARVGRPMSNQYRVDENRDVMLAVDAGRLMVSPIGDLTRLDVALEAVAVLAVAAEDAGDRVGTLAFEAKVSRQLPPGRRNAEAVVRALFDLEPTEVESDYERAFYAVGRQKRALVVLFTDIVDEGAARTLLGALPVLLRRHAVLIASSIDPDLAATLSTPPVDVYGVMRIAVATDLLASRARSIALLRSLGADVVEAAPQSLGPACVQAYLRLKQRARL
ncbi:MAG TPA: DUF58 domain-containing protein [Acidimicrobiales bacterium]|nr:DUF58 domain-containing protein [Acidimicrobiales bacterium]